MMTREEAARFAERQFADAYDCPLEKGRQWHYGKQDVRALLDFIYGGPPENEAQQLKGKP